MAQTGWHLAQVMGLFEDGEPIHLVSDADISSMQKLVADIDTPGIVAFMAEMVAFRAELHEQGLANAELEDPAFIKVHDARFYEMVSRFERPDLGPAFVQELNARLDKIYPWADADTS